MRALLLLLALTAASAADTLPPVVYLPYDQAAGIDPTGRAVLVPYRQFLELWERTSPRPADPPEPPEPALVAWDGSGVLTGTLAEADLRLVVASARRGWATVSVDLPVSGVRAPDGLLVEPDGGTLRIHLPGPGRWTVPVGIAAPITVAEGRSQTVLRLPAAPGRLTLHLPEPGAVAVPDERTALLATATATGAVLRLVAGGPTQVAWIRPAPVLRAEPLVLAQVDAVATVADGSLRLDATVLADLLRRPQEDLRIRLAPGTQVLEVACPSLRTWDRDGDDLVLRFHSPVEGRVQATLRTERGVAADLLEITAPAVVGAARQAGHLALVAGDGIGLTAGTGGGWTQVDPRSIGLPAAVGAWRYLGTPAPLAATAARLAAEIRASVAQLVTLDAEEDRLQWWADLDIRRAGLFTVVVDAPADWELVDTGGLKVDDIRALPVADGRRGHELALRMRVLGETRLTATFRRAATLPREPAAAATRLGAVRIRGARSQRGLFAVTAPGSWALTVARREALGPADEPRVAAAPWRAGGAAPEALAFAWLDGREPALDLAVAPRSRELVLRQEELLTLGDGALRRQITWTGEVRHRPLAALRVQVPTALDGRFTVSGAAEQAAVERRDGWTTWELRLANPVLGPLALGAVISGDAPALGPVAATLAVPAVRPLDADRLAVAMAIARDGSLELTAAAAGLDSSAPADLPPALQRPGVVAGFTGPRPAEVVLTATRHELVPLADAGLPLVRQTVVVAADGLVRVRTVAQVVSRGRPHLDLEPAPGATLLEATVDGRLARTSSRADGRIVVPLDGPGTHVVALVFESRIDAAAGWHSASVALPRLGGPQAPVERQLVGLWLPGTLQVTGLHGDCRPLDAGDGLWTVLLRRWLPGRPGADLPVFSDDDRHGLTVPVQPQGRMTALVRMGDGGVVGWSALPGWLLDAAGLVLGAVAAVLGWRWRARPAWIAGLVLVAAVLLAGSAGPWLRPALGLGLGALAALALAAGGAVLRRLRRRRLRDPLVEG
ncbi:MAG: hypothetical protein RLZZ127_872 [Planctomycetota bacterium]|jgi:hypothetical protein